MQRNNFNCTGFIVHIWWDGIVRIRWDDGSFSVCNMSDIVIIASVNGRHKVREKTVEDR